MKSARPLLIGITALCAVLLVGAVLALNASFQTWWVHRWLANHPELRLTIGRVDAGLHQVELTDVHYASGGLKFHLPKVNAEASFAAALLHRRFNITKLTAEEGLVEVTDGNATAAAVPPVAHAGAAPANTAQPVAALVNSGTFRGLFPLLDLPADVTLGQVQFSGEIRSHEATSLITITGGGLGAGRDGRFTVTARAALSDADVQTLRVNAQVSARMDTPRTFAQVAATVDATAEGTQLAHAVSLHGEVEAHRAGAVERYSFNATQGDRDLATVNASFTEGGHQVTGAWKLDIRDTDIAAFTLGRRLPQFAAAGAGTLDADASFSTVHASGHLAASLDHLGLLYGSLAGVGAIKLNADVDLARRDGVIAVSKLNAEFAGDPVGTPGGAPAPKSVATLHALQAFEFNPTSGEVKATDGATDLVGIVLHGVPLTWAKPFVGDLSIEGSDVRGELTATPRAGGMTFRSKTPLTISRLAVSQPGRVWLRDLDVSLSISGDYTPRGWQAELSGLTARTGAATVMLIDAKAGRLAQPGQPVKATGLITADLAALLAQPGLQGGWAVKRGEASMDFVASFGGTKEIQATVSIKNLASMFGTADEPLPTVAATVRADIAENGRTTINAPITLQLGGRTSDLTVAGSFASADHGTDFEAQLTSKNIVVQDVQALESIVALKRPEVDSAAPPWVGWNGSIALQLKRLLYAGNYQVSNVVGTVRLAGGAVHFEGMRAAIGEIGEAQGAGTVTFDPKVTDPYAFAGDIAVTDFDPGPLFLAVNPSQPPTVQGRFTITSKLSSHARKVTALSDAPLGDFQFTSRSGVYRGIPVNVGNLVENSSKLRAWLAAAGDVITSPFMGTKDQDEITSRSQAANELAKILSNIAYDQLAIVISREEVAKAYVKEFTLISPELRINGSGFLRRGIGPSVLNDVADLELHLRARGRTAELMKILGILEPKADDLGYAACTIPVHVDGTLDRLATPQLNNRLVALAVEKSGITEKAVDWINRLRGKSTN